MIAFVLSGAGNRGPLQVGAVRALLDQGIKPDFIVGTSAGAINGVALAAHGVDDPAITDRMATLWGTASAAKIYPGNIFQIGWRILNKEESIYPNDGVRELIQSALPANVSTFADLKVPFYVTSTDLTSLRLFLFGQDTSAPLLEAVSASAAVPVMHPPILYQDLQLVDGGAVANVPVSIAMDLGATVIYAINAGYDDKKQPPVDGIFELLNRTLATLTTQSFLVDLERATKDTAVDLHHIQVTFPEKVSFRDFSKTAAMVDHGKALAKAYLQKPQPRAVAPVGTPTVYGATVGAAREYIPPQNRR
ncbi:MAG: patatin-like phospholipase family protein [Caldilineaceae bacterium]|nr:patatin-like phospholipase family protein [Caldilineaceae bacterium]